MRKGCGVQSEAQTDTMSLLAVRVTEAQAVRVTEAKVRDVLHFI